MRRIETETLRAIPILDIAAKLGITVRGKQAMCFSGHDKSTPSLSFQPDKNLWNCFGACGQRGDGIGLVMAVQELDFKSACAWLASNYGLATSARDRAVGRPRQVARVSQPPTDAPVVTQPTGHAVDVELYEWFVDHCGEVARNTGVEYLREHGISSDVARRLGLREVNDARRALSRLVDTWGEERVCKSGIAHCKAGRPVALIWRTYAIIFPFYVAKQLVYIQGRLFAGKCKYLGLVGIEKPLFNMDALTKLKPGTTLYVCEGVPDAVAALGRDLPAVAVLGVSSFRREWVELMLKFDVVLLPDGDQAGDRFLETTKKSFADRGKAIRFAILPRGSDVADVIARMKVKK